MSDSEKKQFKMLVERGLLQARNPEGAKNTLAILFPKVEQAIETYVPSDSDVATRTRKRRISLIDFSKSYFALSPQSDSWGQREFETIIRTTPAEAFAALNKKLKTASTKDQSDLRRIFIELLDAEFSSNKELNLDWLTQILEESPRLIAERDEESKFLFSIDNKDRLRWLIVNGLAKLPTEKIVPLVESTIGSASDLTLLADIVRGTVGDAHPDGEKSERGRITFGSEAERIRDALLDRIRELARSNEIWNQARPDELLWFWWSADKEDEVKDFTRRAMETRAGLVSLLNRCIGRVRSSSGNYERVSQTWSKIVDLDALRERAVALMRTGSDTDVKLAEKFLIALQRGQQSSF